MCSPPHAPDYDTGSGDCLNRECPYMDYKKHNMNTDGKEPRMPSIANIHFSSYPH
jgi:hypothetical protein